MEHHLNIIACPTPGVTGVSVWDCGATGESNPLPGYKRGKYCAEGETEFPVFANSAYNNYSMGLTLPPGTGIKLNGYHSLVLVAHYPNHTQLHDGFTGVSGVQIKLQEDNDNSLAKVGILNLIVWGTIPAKTTTRITGIFTIDELVVIKLIAANFHTHELTREILMNKIDSNNNKTLVMKLEAQHDLRHHYVHNNITLRNGDKIEYSCLVHNSLPIELLVM